MWADVVSRRHYAGRTLGEDDGMVRLVGFITGVVTTLIELLGVRSIVLAYTEDVSTTDGR